MCRPFKRFARSSLVGHDGTGMGQLHADSGTTNGRSRHAKGPPPKTEILICGEVNKAALVRWALRLVVGRCRCIKHVMRCRFGSSPAIRSEPRANDGWTDRRGRTGPSGVTAAPVLLKPNQSGWDVMDRPCRSDYRIGNRQTAAGHPLRFPTGHSFLGRDCRFVTRKGDWDASCE